MSLNRRLYAWLIGTDANGLPISVTGSSASPAAETGSLERQDSEPNVQYFDQHSKAFLVQAVKKSLSSDVHVDEDQKSSLKLRPFKILMSLLDKPEIGSAILEDIFLDVLRCIYHECVTKAGDHCVSSKISQSSGQKNDDSAASISDVIKTANLLLSSLEPSFIWQFIGQSLEAACAGTSANQSVPVSESVSLQELCTIINFMLDKLSVVCKIVYFCQLFILSLLFLFFIKSTAGFSAIKTSYDLIICASKYWQ